MGCTTPLLDLGHQKLDIRFTKGVDKVFDLAFTIRETGLPLDLTGYVFTAGIVAPAVSFDVSNTVPLTGIITVTIDAADTSGVIVGNTYEWYLSHTLSTKVDTVFKGSFFVV